MLSFPLNFASCLNLDRAKKVNVTFLVESPNFLTWISRFSSIKGGRSELAGFVFKCHKHIFSSSVDGLYIWGCNIVLPFFFPGKAVKPFNECLLPH